MMNLNWSHFQYVALVGLGVVFVVYIVVIDPGYTDKTMLNLQEGMSLRYLYNILKVLPPFGKELLP